MKVSFEGLGEKVATFWNAPDAAAVAGKAVKIPEACTVKLCADGDKVAGVCVDADLCMATVKLDGFVTVPYTGAAPAVGFSALSADAAGGVRVNAAGREYLVLEVDTAAKTVGFIL